MDGQIGSNKKTNEQRNSYGTITFTPTPTHKFRLQNGETTSA